jgi:hypothetical protein
MAAINFPNPGTQSPSNTFSPSSSPSRTLNGLTYVWNGVGWRIKPSSTSPGGATVTISDTAPGDSLNGDLWWDSGEPTSLFIYYTDPTSSQWVPATPQTDSWYINGGQLVPSQTNQSVNIGTGALTAGSASFAGNLTIGDDPTVGVATGVKAYSGGALYVTNSKGTSPVFEGRPKGTGDATSSIKADGSATFMGPVGVNRNIDDNSAAFYVENSTGVVGRLNCDGSADLAGDIQVTQSAGTERTIQVGTIDTPGKVSIRSNGNAYFAGEVTEGNTFLTLDTGGTIDVKERLQNTQAALTSLKTAAAAASDFATLKAAIASALANI